MEIKVLGSTKLGYQLSKDEALELTGKEANICYTTHTIDDIFSEDKEKSIARAGGVLSSGHHSVAEHVKLNLGISMHPKILAMLLNNEGVYSTSEKSARYTKMKPLPQEQEMYNKWLDIFSNLIEQEYGNKFRIYQEKICKNNPKKEPEKEAIKQITKLAQENARYMISVFTPTIMGYTVDLRQLNYLMTWFKKYISEEESTPFSDKLKPYLQDFISQLEPYTIKELEDKKNRKLSLFDDRENRHEFFDEAYSVNYIVSFAELAQAQRHRTIRYKMKFLPEPQFYTPVLIQDNETLKNEWQNDIQSLAEFFPQGMMVAINERGTYEDFLQKCSERLCGCAQLEISLQTKNTLERYVEETKKCNEEVYKKLLPYLNKARCQCGWKCDRPCVWGAGGAFDRKV